MCDVLGETAVWGLLTLLKTIKNPTSKIAKKISQLKETCYENTLASICNTRFLRPVFLQLRIG